MGRIRTESRGFEDWRLGLADPAKQWRQGYSAYELARAWCGALAFPAAVRRAFAGHPLLADAELLLGLPEYWVRLSRRGHGSQVDLLVLCREQSRPDGLVAVAVEGKVSESFGPTVGAWRRDRKKRNAADCDTGCAAARVLSMMTRAPKRRTIHLAACQLKMMPWRNANFRFSAGEGKDSRTGRMEWCRRTPT